MDTKSFRSSAGTDSRLIFISIYVGIVLRVHDIMLRRHSRHNSDHTLFEEKIDGFRTKGSNPQWTISLTKIPRILQVCLILISPKNNLRA